MTGSGLLPIAVHNNTIYFLIGRENKHNDSPGWSDFGGGMESGETPMDTCLREVEEETAGFIQKAVILKSIQKHGTLTFHMKTGQLDYHTTLVIIDYDPLMPIHFNNNHQFIETHFPKIVKSSVFFEKDKMKWVTFSEMKRNLGEFRKFYCPMIQHLIKERKEINRFVKL